MKKSIILSMAALASLVSSAKDVETMVVTLNDGSTQEFNVENITDIQFNISQVSYAFTVTPAGGEEIGYNTIPSMFRVNPAETGLPTEFGFGTVEATEPSGLTSGEYGLWLTISASKIYTGEFDLAENANSFTLKLIKYADDVVESVNETVVSGTISSSRNVKTGAVTLKVDATYEDGTVVAAEYTGKPTDVESLEAMNPAHVLNNEFHHFRSDGSEVVAHITEVSMSENSKGQLNFTFTLDNAEFSTPKVMILKSLVGTGDIDLPNTQTGDWTIYFGGIQLAAPETYRNVPDNGVMNVTEVSEGVYEIYLEVANSYTTDYGWGTPGKGGDNQKILLYYKGEVVVN